MTEQNQLIWLKRWAEFMEGRDWDQLMRRAPIADDVAFPSSWCGDVVMAERAAVGADALTLRLEIEDFLLTRQTWSTTANTTHGWRCSPRISQYRMPIVRNLAAPQHRQRVSDRAARCVLVRRGQGDAGHARGADLDRRALGGGAAVADLASDHQCAHRRGDALGADAQDVEVSCNS